MLNNFTSGVNTTFSDELNENSAAFLTQSGLNLIRQLQDRDVDFSSGQIEGWAEAYVVSEGGQLGSVKTVRTNAVYNGANTYSRREFDESVYAIIEVSNPNDITFSDYEKNDCIILPNEENESRFLVYVDTNETDTIKRSKLYATLFWGDIGQKIENTASALENTSNVQSIETSISRDVGKRAYVYEAQAKNGNSDSKSATAQWQLSFDSQTNNQDVSSWSDLYGESNGSNDPATGRWEIPTGTTRNTVDSGIDNSSDSSLEIGTDTTSDEVSNPTDALLEASVGSSNDNFGADIAECFNLILTNSSITATQNSTTNLNSTVSYTEIDYFSDENIPSFSSVSSFDKVNYTQLITHSVPSGQFPSNISNAIGVPFISDWENGSDIEYRISNGSGDDTGWLPAYQPSVSEFTQFSAEPDTLEVRLVPKDTSPSTNTPSIKGFYVRAT